jgi:hypothetical protein
VQDVAGVELSAEHVLAEKLLDAFRSDSSTIVDLVKKSYKLQAHNQMDRSLKLYNVETKCFLKID